MKDCTVIVLGTKYSIFFRTEDDDEDLADCDGYCDYSNKTIVIKSDNTRNLGDFEWAQRKALRHEIIHAFLSESGLQSNFEHCRKFGHDETMVDWFAIQYPKIAELYRKLNIEE